MGRGVVLATWLSLLTLLLATFSWLPAAANEATPEDQGTESQIESLESTEPTTGEGDPPSTSSIQSLDEPAPPAMALSGVDANCIGASSTVTGSITLTDAEAGQTIALAIVDESTNQPFELPVGSGVFSEPVTTTGLTSAIYTFDLTDVSVSGETSALVRASYNETAVIHRPS